MGSSIHKSTIDKYYNNDLPTMILADGTQMWHKKYRLHSLTAIRPFGTHRDDGPALIWTNGELEWHKNGYRYIPQMKKL